MLAIQVGNFLHAISDSVAANHELKIKPLFLKFLSSFISHHSRRQKNNAKANENDVNNAVSASVIRSIPTVYVGKEMKYIALLYGLLVTPVPCNSSNLQIFPATKSRKTSRGRGGLAVI